MITIPHPGTRRLAVLVALVAATLPACAADGGSIARVGDPEGAPDTVEAVDDAARCAGDPSRPDTHRYADIDGVDPDLLSLDVFTGEEAQGCPVVVWVHGGGWRRGDKTSRGIEEKVRFLGRLGVSVISINYRLAQDGTGVRWPDFGRDVASAVAWVVENGPGLGLDPARLALMGHSAGAHLVSIVATDPSLLGAHGLTRDAIDCVVSLDTAADELRGTSGGLGRLVEQAFGEDPNVQADASPIVQAAAHPDGIPPFLLVTRGRSSRIDEAESFATVLRQADTEAEVLNANPYTHMEVNTRLGADGEAAVTAPVSRFLAACLADT